MDATNKYVSIVNSILLPILYLRNPVQTISSLCLQIRLMFPTIYVFRLSHRSQYARNVDIIGAKTFT